MMFNCTKSFFTSKLIIFNSNLNLLNKLTAYIGRKCYNSLLHVPLKLKVKDVALDKYVRHLENEYNRLSENSSNSRPQQIERLRELEPIITILQHRNTLIKDIENLTDLLNDTDDEIKRLAQDESILYENKVNEVEGQLFDALLPDDVCDRHNSIMLEVNSGVGGQEAMLFAKELFYMYSSFAQYKKWNLDIVGYVTTETGGIRHAVALINGEDSFRYFKFEAGIHRVQRIPATEKTSRMHTSTVSVLVLPEPTDIEIAIDNKDLRIETKRASGAGGQHVNTTDSAVRIIHIPTGTTVECQEDRSQIKNKRIAMQKLRSVLYERQRQEQNEKIESTRKTQVKSNFRNEKIRTYNFNQDRITDHRLQSSHVHNLKTFLTGGESLERLMNKLHETYRIERLLDAVLELDDK